MGIVEPPGGLIASFGQKSKKLGVNWELNPGPLAPKARIIPLDH
jgi:hypothetical protein